MTTTMTFHEQRLERRLEEFFQLAKANLANLEQAQQSGRLSTLDDGLEFMARAFFSEEQLWTLEKQSHNGSWQSHLSMLVWFELEDN